MRRRLLVARNTCHVTGVDPPWPRVPGGAARSRRNLERVLVELRALTHEGGGNVRNISRSLQTNYPLLFHFMDQIRNLSFNLVSAITVLCSFLGGGLFVGTCSSVTPRLPISFSAPNDCLMNVSFWIWRQTQRLMALLLC